MVRQTKFDVDDGASSELEIISFYSTEFKIRSSASSFEIEPCPKPIPCLPAVNERQRCVRFSVDHTVFPVSNRHDIPKDWKTEIWYRRSEIKKMRKAASNRPIEGAVEGDGTDDDHLVDDSYCDASVAKDDFLECQRALHKLMAVCSVLEEQARQRKENDIDPIKISEKYQCFVARARQSVFVSQLARKSGIRFKSKRHQ